ncbi:endonuclease/exonuclease/phosphatase family protein [Novosphingobium aquimarinum]|uniref:endonuclease/exonuclease/phosphatase family protein n=1 Tax=Novosphingobium aquimarinum TaxID=2682494 RepID=UPI0018DBB91A|nr:endonuclease/exonuclease/phosphatase family protein [Novosphingobium aquimarinum]
MKFYRYAMAALSALALALVLISLVHTNAGFIRVLDFVREPALYGLAALALLALLTLRKWRWLIAAGFVLAAGIELARVWPYVSIAKEEVVLERGQQADHCFSALALNVKMENTEYGRVADLIARRNPDLLLLMETNRTWMEALEPALSRYPFVISKPFDNTYGMVFASRIPVDSARMVANTASNTPTLYATLRPASGRSIEFVGLHPRPPLPGQSTDARDKNIARAGAITPDGSSEVVVMGDFNDVPWSHTTRRFVREGHFLDPRIGRGSYPTFPASMPWLGWPLDQFFLKGKLSVAEFAVLDTVGSDHLPLEATVCLDQNPVGTRR